jgi:23S rRNA (pseudouridine1915-N3)-methyltransferase
MEITILSIGKNKESWLEEGCSLYIKRLRPTMTINCLWLRDDAQLIRAATQQRHVVCLDANGMTFSSEEFATFFNKQIELGGARLAFVIGGATGLPAALKKGYPLISLSPLTLTHQMVRLLLLEQIYRANEILRGSPYHK